MAFVAWGRTSSHVRQARVGSIQVVCRMPLCLTFYEGFGSVKVLGFWICLGSHSSIRACGVESAAQVGGFRGGVVAPSTNER
jgi:hypothetical protein